MSITLLHGCFHIELVVRDLDQARTFMKDVLGAAGTEEEFASDLRQIVPDDYGIDQLDCGQATFQLNQPSASMAAQGVESSWQTYLDEGGPCVTNLNFYIDDATHARELLGRLGAKTLLEGPSSIAKSLADYGPNNTRPDGDKRPFLYIGARALIGFDLEIMEPNFVRFTEQTAQRPCYVGERPGNRIPGLRLQRLVVAVDDVTATYANLCEIFNPGSRSNPYAVRQGTLGRAFRITLGGIELEYCQPIQAEGSLAEHLARYGPGVVNAEFGAPAVGSALERACARAGLRMTDEVDLLGTDRDKHRSQITSRELVGFDVVVEELDTGAPPVLMYRDS